VFIPIYDQNPLRSIRFQAVTASLVVVNVAIFLLQIGGLPTDVILGFALVPTELFGLGVAGTGGALSGGGEIAVPERLTLLSYMFFHGDIFHLVGNMLFLWVFGDNVEDALGHFRFLFFYLACGIAGGLLHALMLPTSDMPLIGASGAVAGVIAAYLMLHPRVQVWVLIFRFIPIRISAAFALGAWIATQFVMVLLPQVQPVAWWAHVGGILAGAVLVVFMRRPGVPLFDRGLA
jgi:membrane associated rhomboid family serine protease